MKTAAGKLPKLYKILKDGCSFAGGRLEWSLPTKDAPGEWHEVDGPLVQCQNGLHLTDDPKQREHYGYEVYLAETDGEIIRPQNGGDEYVARKVRLLRRLSVAELDEMKIGVRTRYRATRRSVRSERKFIAEEPSPAFVLVDHVWQYAQQAGKKDSWRDINGTMSQALGLALSAGMEFALDDFSTFYRKMSGHYWIGDIEHVYARAAENISACKSIEAHLVREPFMWSGKRLYVGADLSWDNQRCCVTSMSKDALIACSYKPRERSEPVRIAKRYTIAREALKAADKERERTEKGAREAERLAVDMRRHGTNVDPCAVAAWTSEQRAEAREWIVLSQRDRGKTRVRPPEKPAHVAAAEVA